MNSLLDFYEAKEDGVFYVGHASIIAKLRGKNYLFDYIKNSQPYGGGWKFFPPLIHNINLDYIDGIFVSHLHQDHLDLNFLSEAQNHCPIYIIDGRPEFNKILKDSGIRFSAIEPNKKNILVDGVYVYGVLHDTNGIDSSCVLATDSFSIYHGNDNYCSLKHLAAIREEFGRIDVACVPYAYINWYPQLLSGVSEEFRKLESNRLVTEYFELALAQARELNASQTIPFGANLVYCDSAYSPANLECKTPLEFESYVLNTYGENLAKRFRALFSGDMIFKDGEANLSITQLRKYDPNTYREEIEDYLKGFQYSEPEEVGEEVILAEKQLDALNCRIKRSADFKIDHEILLTSPNLNPYAVCVDLSLFAVSKIKMTNDFNRKRHIFTTTDSLLNRWIKSDIRFEEIIGSRKFTLERIPNEYSPDILRVISTLL